LITQPYVAIKLYDKIVKGIETRSQILLGN